MFWHDMSLCCKKIRTFTQYRCRMATVKNTLLTSFQNWKWQQVVFLPPSFSQGESIGPTLIWAWNLSIEIYHQRWIHRFGNKSGTLTNVWVKTFCSTVPKKQVRKSLISSLSSSWFIIIIIVIIIVITTNNIIVFLTFIQETHCYHSSTIGELSGTENHHRDLNAQP